MSSVFFDAYSGSPASVVASPLTWTHTPGTSNATSLILVQVSVDSASSDAAYSLAVTYGGHAMTSLKRWESGGAAQSTGYTQVFYLFSPPQGAQTITATLSGSGGTLTGLSGGAVSYLGAGALGTPVTADSNGAVSGTGSIAIPVASAASMTACFVANGSGNTVFGAASSGQAVSPLYAVQADATHAAGSSAAASGRSSGATSNFSWTQTSAMYGAIGVEIQPATGWALMASGSQAFTTDSTTGVTWTLPGGAPAGGLFEVLYIASVVQIPVGGVTSGAAGGPWNLLRSAVDSNQASYLYYRFSQGTEASTVTVKSSFTGYAASAQYMRWAGSLGGQAFAGDVYQIVTSTNATGTSSPALATGALAGSGELVLGFAGCENDQNSAPALTGWSAGLTDAGNGPAWNWDATHAHGCGTFAAYDTSAPQAGMTVQASWSWTSTTGDLHTAVVAVKPRTPGTIDFRGTTGFGGGNSTGPMNFIDITSGGRTLVLAGYFYSNSVSDYPTSVTDTSGNVWQVSIGTATSPPTDQIFVSGTGYVTTWIAWCLNALPIGTITVHRQDDAVSDWWRVCLIEYEGIAALDSANHAQTASSVTSFNMPSLTLTNANDVVVAVVADLNASSETPPAGYVNMPYGFSTWGAGAFGYPGVTGAYSPAWSGSAAGPWSAVATAFTPAVSSVNVNGAVAAVSVAAPTGAESVTATTSPAGVLVAAPDGSPAVTVAGQPGQVAVAALYGRARAIAARGGLLLGHFP